MSATDFEEVVVDPIDEAVAIEAGPDLDLGVGAYKVGVEIVGVDPSTNLSGLYSAVGYQTPRVVRVPLPVLRTWTVKVILPRGVL